MSASCEPRGVLASDSGEDSDCPVDAESFVRFLPGCGGAVGPDREAGDEVLGADPGTGFRWILTSTATSLAGNELDTLGKASGRVIPLCPAGDSGRPSETRPRILAAFAPFTVMRFGGSEGLGSGSSMGETGDMSTGSLVNSEGAGEMVGILTMVLRFCSGLVVYVLGDSVLLTGDSLSFAVVPSFTGGLGLGVGSPSVIDSCSLSAVVSRVDASALESLELCPLLL